MDAAKPRNFDVTVTVEVTTNDKNSSSFTNRSTVAKGLANAQGEMGWEEIPELIKNARARAEGDALRRLDGSEARFAEAENEGLRPKQPRIRWQFSKNKF